MQKRRTLKVESPSGGSLRVHLHIQNIHFIEITRNTAHEKFQKRFIFSENMQEMVSMCHTSGVQTVFVFVQFHKLKLAC